MYRLARIRLSGVGPADARFDKPSPDAPPFEVSCMGSSGAPVDSVIWLENGGGKTVFLALLFHVLRPDKASQIGNDEKGRRAEIPDFVLAGDVAHVVCEWVAADGDTRLITGLVADRRGANVNRTWYLMSVRDGALSLDDLVFDVEGRRVPMARYIESLEQLASKAGKSGRQNRVVLTKTGVQRQWFDVLADHDLDPALFEYQVRMNRSEGGATSLFRFASAEKFVEFFLQLTMNPDTVAALTDELGHVADKVSSLPRKELELAHATAASERLTKLKDGWSAFEDADRSRRDAHHAAEQLHDRLTAAVDAASEEHAAAVEAAAAAEEELSAAAREGRESVTRSRIIALALANARVARLEAAVAAAEKRSTDAALTADAWPRVPQLLRRSALDGEIGETKTALEAANEDAAPLFGRRDALLRTLRSVLAGQMAAAQADLDDVEVTRAAAENAEHAADVELGDASGAEQKLNGRIVEIEGQVARYATTLRNAVNSGLLSTGIEPEDALRAAGDEVTAATGAVERLDADRRVLVDDLPKVRDARETTADTATRLAGELNRHRHVVDAALSEREALASHPLLAELGAENADLELVGADLATRVSAEADRRRVDAIAAVAVAAEDQRAADTLERDRLLPARTEVEALCRQLTEGGVASAVPGWRYLVANVPAERRDVVVNAHPALLDGIVVATHDLGRARELLADAAPSAAILVGAGAVLTETSPTATAGWVVPPAAAMLDMGAAEVELDRRRERIDSADTTAARIHTAETKARELAAALTAHLDDWPTGRLPAAVVTLDELNASEKIARAAADEARTAVATVEGWIAEIDASLNTERGRLANADRRVTRLETLVVAAATAAAAEASLAALGSERDEFVKAADLARTARNAAREALSTALAHKATAEQARSGASQQLAALPDVEDGPHAEAGDLAELRSAYDAAVRLVAEATTDSELARQLERLDRERADVEAEWSALDAALRERIHELVATPAAGEPAARRHADEEARRAAGVAAKALADVAGRLTVAQNERRGLPAPEPSWPVEPFDIPADIVDLEAFSLYLEAEVERTRVQRSGANEKHEAMKLQRDACERRRDAINAQRSALGHTVGEREAQPAAPFAGDAPEAVAAALRALTEANSRREQTDATWRATAGSLGRWARDQKWKDLTGDLARRLRDDDAEVLAKDSANILTQTEILEGRLRDDIDHLDLHRQMLVTSLGDAVSEAARSLRSARKKSELPAQLGDWSHQPFLKIGCDIAKDRTELDARLRRFTNDLLERAAVAGLPTGADLICRAVLACAEKEVTVEVLKPNKAQRLRYVPITEIATLSGGMRATAAIAMFCTLAKVRAANRSGRIGLGTLVLDNPLGDANATYLVALQRLVAQMSDVQLVYTTGVNDMDALRMFPVVTRLTNEAAKRSHLAYVIADEAFLKRLAPADGDNATLTGTRLVRRQQPLLAVDLAELPGDDE